MKKAKTPGKRKQSPFVKLLSSVMIIAMLLFAGLMLTNSVKEIIQTAQLNKELKNVQSQLETLEVEKTDLNTQKLKLEDPAYVQNYARGTELLSKSGEQVFILPKSDD